MDRGPTQVEWSGDKVREVQRKMTENINGCSKGGEGWCEGVRDSVRWSTVVIPKGSIQKTRHMHLLFSV